MATADQIKNLVKAYIEHNDDRFKTVVLQIAAHEAKVGHDNFARELKAQVDKMAKNIADLVGTDLGNVNVKATTEEKLGFTGEEKGIAAHAVCLLEEI